MSDRRLRLAPLDEPVELSGPRRRRDDLAARLNRADELRLEQATEFLLALDGEMRTDPARAAYLLGQAEMHLGNVIELLRAVA